MTKYSAIKAIDRRAGSVPRRFPRTRELSEKVFVVASLCIFMGAATSIFVSDGELTEDARAALRVLFFPVYGATLLLMVPLRRKIPEVLKDNWHLVLPYFLACASISWSIGPEISTRRCIALLFTGLFGIYLAERYSLPTLLRLFAAACGTIIVLSYVCVFLLPGIGINPEDGSWRGIFRQKNGLGPCALLAILVLVRITPNSARQRAIQWIGLCLAAIMIWFSGSRTPLVTLAVVAPLALLIWTFRFGVMPGVAGSLMVSTAIYFIGVFVVLNSTEVLEFLGKDATLTGRTELWPMVEAAIADRPWIGYGYGAFWEAPTGPSRSIWQLLEWDVPHAHNGYIELALGLGVAGPLLFLFLLAVNFRTIVGALRKGRHLEGEWCAVVTFMTMLAAINESILLDANSISSILLVSSTIYARRASHGRRAQPAALPRSRPTPGLSLPRASRLRPMRAAEP